MLYATIDKKRWDSIPAEWDEVQDMFKYLNRMTYGYQLNMERTMFNAGEGYPYRAVLIRWGTQGDARNGHKTRDVLLETTDPEQMKAALLMLISEAEVLARGHKMSIVPLES